MSQFAFSQTDFPEVFQSARRSESLANSDPRASCFYTRRALELAVAWAYEHDATLNLPYREDLSALIHESTFRNLVGQAIFQKCRAIKELGNLAVHSAKPISRQDAADALRELFHVCFWLVRTYATGPKPDPSLSFDPNLLPIPRKEVQKQTIEQLQKLSDEVKLSQHKLLEALADKENLDDELKRLRAELFAVKKANEAVPDNHNYSEAQTRDLFIDLLLREAGWALDQPEDREYEVEGMPNSKNKGFVDYVLWGKDGTPLGLVEAKRTRRDPKEGQHQAKLYADCLAAKFGTRPVIFYTNGYEHHIWDDSQFPSRPIQGFYTRDELELLIQRRTSKKSLVATPVNEKIVERYYQKRAIIRVGEAFEKDKLRRALLVMATGSGKTRTVIALTDLMMRCNWAKRILFLADRVALVNQAVKAFKEHLPESAPVNLVTERDTEGRVYVSTYPTMIGLIDETKGDLRKYGPGYFDLIIIDEAHRSIYMKYGSIFEYFDSHLVGLTATPKEDVDHNTYSMFELEDGVPTDVYPLSDAIAEGFLVEPKTISIPMKFPTLGITYDSLSEEEKEQFDLTDWKERSEDVMAAKTVRAQAVNKWLFNKNTVDKGLKHLMENGLKIDGGDKLGKTIIFAKNRDHAAFIEKRFNANYPHFKGEFARVVEYKTEYVQNIIDNFSNPSKVPQIAISVDMLDTGIDVPEILNLVYFKEVRSKTKFWQMLGRGTRLCPNVFAPGKDKEFFYLFDFCRNLEFFSQDLPEASSSSGASLSKRLFEIRLDLLNKLGYTAPDVSTIALADSAYGEPKSDADVFRSIVDLLKKEVSTMNVSNFIVRTKRQIVEKYQDSGQWAILDETKVSELEREIAGLPTELPPEAVEAKMFDLLMLRLQLGCLKASPGFAKLRQQVQDIASVLEESASIPKIREHLELIQDLQTEGWWEDVTVPMLELVRLRIRELMHLIARAPGNPVYTDFEDEIGEEVEIVLPGVIGQLSFERFREKARSFLLNYQDSAALQKLKLNIPLTTSDLDELNQILIASGTGSETLVAKAAEDGLGVFVRSLVGLDREAAKTALNVFILGKTPSANQIEFVNLIVDYLTEHGIMSPRALYESPFTDISPKGPDGVFDEATITSIIDALNQIRDSAVA